MLLFLIGALSFFWPQADSFAFDSREADLVSVGAVLGDPQLYNLHRVRFHGLVTHVTTLPNQGGCGKFDAYLFHLEDETGSIEVFDTGWCTEEGSVAPLLAVSPVQAGDKISIATTIVYSSHAPGAQLRARLHWIGREPEGLP